MASYASVVPTDPNYEILSKLDKVVNQYVVTYLGGLPGVRNIYGVYKSVRRAVKACNQVRGFSPSCFLINLTGQYFVRHAGHDVP